MASPTPLLRVAPSGVHGVGAFAAQDIPAGTPLGLYAGRRFSPEQLADADWNDRVTYLFGLSDGDTIDGAKGGNATRHINHSCLPNCEAVEEHGRRGRLVLKIYSLIPVQAGDELFLDYGLVIDPGDTPSTYRCFCGSAGCRGTMVATHVP